MACNQRIAETGDMIQDLAAARIPGGYLRVELCYEVRTPIPPA